MAKIETIDDFRNITSRITSFSHAYLFNVNSLDQAYFYVKDFAKQIILGKDCDSDDVISYQIDNDEYDDLYVVNPTTIGINTEEINKLMTYMQTKSLRPNGKRVYIIYGFERLTEDVSNKILKFLEEPSDDIFALLMTANFEKILPTIVSRCQVINLFFPPLKFEDEKISKMQLFLKEIIEKKQKTIAFEYEIFGEALFDREEFYKLFEVLEKIISETINDKYQKRDNIYRSGQLLDYPNITLINILNITNKLKCLIKGNINLNLLLDRYIIEITEELTVCKE